MAATTRKGLIFISCGQVTDQEKALGKQVCSLVVEMTPHKPYFAENQNTLESFTNNILGSLDDAVGLIAIMHPRGVVTFPNNQQEVRGSVWIEQEIAIAAYIAQIQKRPLRIAPYIHRDVRGEGMREQLLLNAVPFTDDSEVLNHLRGILPSWRDLPADIAERLHRPLVGLTRLTLRSNPDSRTWVVAWTIKNFGTLPATQVDAALEWKVGINGGTGIGPSSAAIFPQEEVESVVQFTPDQNVHSKVLANDQIPQLNARAKYSAADGRRFHYTAEAHWRSDVWAFAILKSHTEQV